MLPNYSTAWIIGDMLDQGHSVDTIYLDFAKAFDIVPHEGLLEKVKRLRDTGRHLRVDQVIH